jgi:hypothetical protein
MKIVQNFPTYEASISHSLTKCLIFLNIYIFIFNVDIILYKY